MNHIRHESDTMNDFVSGREGRDRECTHNESLQVHPIITDQEPHVTGNPKATCSAAHRNRTVCIGVDLEDGIWSY